MRSCARVSVCVWGGTREIVSVSLGGCIHQRCQHSYGQAFSGSMFSSELINLAPCDYVHGYLCVSPRFPLPEKPPWLTKRPPSSITGCPQSRINHQLHSRPPLSSRPVADIHNMSGLGPLSDQSNRFRASSASGQHLKRRTRWDKNKLDCVSEYKQIIRQTGLLSNAWRSLGLIGVLTTIQPYCLE